MTRRGAVKEEQVRHQPSAPAFRLRALVLTAILVAAGGFAAAQSGVTLTLYSGQHESLANALAQGFEAATGVKMVVRDGKDADLANQIVEEGARSRADVFITEEPSPIQVLASRGLLAEVDQATLAKVDPRFVPSSGAWLPYAARSRAIFYNPTLITEDELPDSILELTDPKWKGTFAYAPSGAFVSTVAYMVGELGEGATLDWLRGIKANGIDLQKNGAVRDAVEAGQVAFGLSNHYYWYILAATKGGETGLTSRVHYMGGGDPGALLLTSGAGILRSSQHQAEAQRFLAWLADPEGGQAIIASTTPQYPLGIGVESSHGLKPLAELEPPEVEDGGFENVDKARELIIAAGIV